MNVTFTSSSMTNSTIINTATGDVLFEFSNPFSLALDTITLYDAQKQVIAVYEEGWISSNVTYRGRTMPLCEWFFKDNILSRCVRTPTIGPRILRFELPLLAQESLLQRTAGHISGTMARRVPNHRSTCQIATHHSPEWGPMEQLTDCQTKKLVAKAHRVRWGILCEPRKLNIDVKLEVIPILDAILFTFVVYEMLATRRRRRREREVIAHKAVLHAFTGGG
ncbi:hypothetical protein C8Q79DRAFT_208823 [Trametes meyenii]|nr:hypothetical protein C8Q79DRAFT_208823 [Trametes meyenii]